MGPRAFVLWNCLVWYSENDGENLSLQRRVWQGKTETHSRLGTRDKDDQGSSPFYFGAEVFAALESAAPSTEVGGFHLGD